MQLDMIRSLFAYNQWASQRLLASLEKLEPEQLKSPLGASFDTIEGTLAHILQGQLYYSQLWLGQEPPEATAEPEDIDGLLERWRAFDTRLTGYLARVSPDALEAVLRSARHGKPWNPAVWQLMLALINHSTHHRSELADMLTRLGQAPEAFDLADYFAASQQGTLSSM